jgi:hypothetical protein
VQAGRGEWFCALDRARFLAGQDRQAQALAVLDPFVATGWWTAAQAVAGLLEGWGRAAEAITLTRPYAEAGNLLALRFLGGCRHGRADEAFDLLGPHARHGMSPRSCSRPWRCCNDPGPGLSCPLRTAPPTNPRCDVVDR